MLAPDAVSVVFRPWHKGLAPAETLTVGVAITVIVAVAVFLQPDAAVPVTL